MVQQQLGEGPTEGLLHTFDASGRGVELGALSYVNVETRAQFDARSGHHTFPDDYAIVQVESLFALPADKTRIDLTNAGISPSKTSLVSSTCGWQAVHAIAGDRANYQPVAFCVGDPIALAQPTAGEGPIALRCAALTRSVGGLCRWTCYDVWALFDGSRR